MTKRRSFSFTSWPSWNRTFSRKPGTRATSSAERTAWRLPVKFIVSVTARFSGLATVTSGGGGGT